MIYNWKLFEQETPTADSNYKTFIVAVLNPYYRKPKFAGDMSASKNQEKYWLICMNWSNGKFYETGALKVEFWGKLIPVYWAEITLPEEQ